MVILYGRFINPKETSREFPSYNEVTLTQIGDIKSLVYAG